MYVFHLQYLLGLLGCYCFYPLYNQMVVFQGFEYFLIYSFRASFIQLFVFKYGFFNTFFGVFGGNFSCLYVCRFG